MKNRFFGGFLSGILASALVIALIGCAGTESVLTRNASNQIETGSSNGNSSMLSSEDYTDKLNTIINTLDYAYYQDLDKDELAEGLYRGVCDAVGDPYTCYYSAEEYAAFNEDNSGNYAGIGSTVSLDEETGYVKIVQPMDGSPAEQAGLMTGDLLIEINGEDAYGMDLDTAVSKVRGEAGTYVELRIYRPDTAEYLDISVLRQEIEYTTVSYQMLEGQIGYIAISQFVSNTDEQFEAAIDDLTEQGMEALLIDVRDNPGGSLDTVLHMMSRIVEKGKLIFYMEDKYGNKDEKFSDNAENVDVPIAVLINENSASASEAFSGCLQSYELAKLVGTKSYGKGIVQSLYPLDDGSALKITTQTYYIPSGVCIHKTGLTPDIEVELTDETFTYGELTVDNQAMAAIDYLNEVK